MTVFCVPRLSRLMLLARYHHQPDAQYISQQYSHDTDNALFARSNLLGHVRRHLGLVQVVLARVAVRAVDHDGRLAGALLLHV